MPLQVPFPRAGMPRSKLLRGFFMLGSVLPAFAQYAGPAILSRGEAPGPMSAAANNFVFSLTLTSDYTNGLIGLSAVNAQGQQAGAFGGGVVIGATGGHSWQHTQLGLNFSGSFKDYTQATSYNGDSQGLSLNLSHLFAPHVALVLRENGGIYSRFLPSTVSQSSSVPFDPSQTYIPAAEFSDNRTIYSTTQANLMVQESAQLSFDLGGGYFLNEQRSSALYGAAGQTATADVQYRLSPHFTIGANYTFFHFSYTHSLGGADVHAAGFSASYRISRRAEMAWSSQTALPGGRTSGREFRARSCAVWLTSTRASPSHRGTGCFSRPGRPPLRPDTATRACAPGA